MNPVTFTQVVQWLPALARLALATADGVVKLVALIQSWGADPEQEAALLTVAHQAVAAERALLAQAPRLDPANPHQVLPPPTT